MWSGPGVVPWAFIKQHLFFKRSVKLTQVRGRKVGLYLNCFAQTVDVWLKGLSVVPPTNPESSGPRPGLSYPLVWAGPAPFAVMRASNHDHSNSFPVPDWHVEPWWRESHRTLGWCRGFPGSDGDLSGSLRALAGNVHHVEPRRAGDWISDTPEARGIECSWRARWSGAPHTVPSRACRTGANKPILRSLGTQPRSGIRTHEHCRHRCRSHCWRCGRGHRGCRRCLRRNDARGVFEPVPGRDREGAPVSWLTPFGSATRLAARVLV